MERYHRAPRKTSEVFTLQIEIESISVILLAVQPETRNANCHQVYLFCKHSEPKWSDSQGSREHLFHYLLKAQQRPGGSGSWERGCAEGFSGGSVTLCLPNNLNHSREVNFSLNCFV